MTDWAISGSLFDVHTENFILKSSSHATFFSYKESLRRHDFEQCQEIA
jgi:hypothetical protein